MILRNAPLVHVLAQIVFEQIPAVAEKIPHLQARFRDLGFLRLVEGVTHQVTVVEGSPPTVIARRRWDLLDRDRTTGIVLSESSLALHTTAYKSSEPFLGMLLEAVRTLQSSVDVKIVDRLGLRYLDLVRPRVDERFDQYVCPGVLGFPFDRLATPTVVNAVKTEAVASTAAGILVVRSMLLPPGQFVPGDLSPSPLVYPPSLQTEQPALSLDFDHFSQQTFDFDSGEIIERMKRLRSAVRGAFDAVCSPYAIEQWGPWEET